MTLPPITACYRGFLYFNAAGADPHGDVGEIYTTETHLIPLVLDVRSGRIPCLQIFGYDNPTVDDICMRDYINVSDLIDAHVLGLSRLLAKGSNHVFNLGSGTDYSMRHVPVTALAVTGPDFCSSGSTMSLWQSARSCGLSWGSPP